MNPEGGIRKRADKEEEIRDIIGCWCWLTSVKDPNKKKCKLIFILQYGKSKEV